MSRGRDTSTFRIDSAVRKQIIRCCSDPERLAQIFEAARDMVFGRATLASFQGFCQTSGCILWQPGDTDSWRVEVRVTRELEPVLVSVTRAVWAIVNVLPEQKQLTSSEEVLHLCGRNGHSSTKVGACLNPAHLIPGNQENRVDLARARKLFDVMLTKSDS